jgi:hypothetical protein
LSVSSRLALVVLVLAACDISGIHPLGRLRDALVPCNADVLGRVETTSTWLRSTDTGTEIFLLGRADPTSVVEPGSAACFGHGFIEHDGSTTLAFGSYTLDASGDGFAVRTLEYTMTYQPERSILSRDGSVRKDLPAPISEELTIAKDGAQIILGLDGEARRLTSIGAVAEAIDFSTQEGAEDVFRLFNVPLLTSQSRLLGFGSGSMTQYVDNTADFSGAIRNRFSVSVEDWLEPNTLIWYFQFEDLTGIVIDGPQKTNVSTSGNGSMTGTLSFLMRGTGGTSDVAIRGHLNYQGLKISDGLAAGGTYTLGIDGVPAAYTISYELATDIDRRVRREEKTRCPMHSCQLDRETSAPPSCSS